MTRRPQGSPEAVEISPGRWKVFVSLGTFPNGRRRRRAVYGTSKRDAERKAQTLRLEYERGTNVDLSRLTVGEMLAAWLDTEPWNTPKGRDHYEGTVRRYLVPALKNVRLMKLTPADVEAMTAEMIARGLSPRTANIARATLRTALNWAMREEWVTRNVAQLADPAPAPRTRRRALTLSQVQAVLTKVHGHRLEAAFVVALGMGLRRGEILGLRWGDIDWERGRITIARQVQRVDGEGIIVRDLKTSSSAATIPAPAFVLDALKSHRARQVAERLRASEWGDGDYVFPSTVGTPLEPRRFDAVWEQVRKDLGITQSLHDLRHTCATLLVSQGVSPKLIQTILRHANIAITMDTYADVYDEDLDNAGSVMSDILTRLRKP